MGGLHHVCLYDNSGEAPVTLHHWTAIDPATPDPYRIEVRSHMTVDVKASVRVDPTADELFKCRHKA